MYIMHIPAKKCQLAQQKCFRSIIKILSGNKLSLESNYSHLKLSKFFFQNLLMSIFPGLKEITLYSINVTIAKVLETILLPIYCRKSYKVTVHEVYGNLLCFYQPDTFLCKFTKIYLFLWA